LSEFAGKWLLAGFVSAAPERDVASRGQITLLESAQAQFRAVGLRVIVIAADLPAAAPAHNLQYDWSLGDIPLLLDQDRSSLRACGLSKIPSTILINPAGKVVWRHDDFVAPGELGLLLRSSLGEPNYAQLQANLQ
jgi:hypothetical protein